MLRSGLLAYFIVTLLFIPDKVVGEVSDLKFPDLSIQLGDVKVYTENNLLLVSNKFFRRTWRLTTNGLRTVDLTNKKSGTNWIRKNEENGADWAISGLVNETNHALLEHIDATISTDENFTSEHVKIVADFSYDTNVAIRYVVWVYPNISGTRTQILVKSLPGWSLDNSVPEHTDNPVSESIPISWTDASRKAIGYFNGTQNRNAANLEILKEQQVTAPLLISEVYDWPSVLVAQRPQEGLVFLKESHKAVNQEGINTGAFYCDKNGLQNTGTGIRLTDITGSYRGMWASWCIPYSGEPIQLESSIKKFDRARYPVNPEKDIYMLANTWGSGNRMDASGEESILTELDIQHDLGIDVQQIDDGWQNPPGTIAMHTVSWKPNPKVFPSGWEKIKESADEKNIDLGIWFSLGSLNDVFEAQYGSNWSAEPDDLKRAWDDGRFKYYKFDMINLHDYEDLESLMRIARDFTQYTKNQIRINWDVTESEARTGYFFAREFGNIYLANRPTNAAKGVTYVPYLMLRDAWQIAKYINLNKFQITIQNTDRVDENFSNASQYGHEYATAIALMGSPIFFQETKLYTEEARKDIKSLLRIYKKYRNDIYSGFVYPIGEKPDDQSWTGFQNHASASDDHGYLLVYREQGNKHPKQSIKINFCENERLLLTDLISNEERVVECNAEGEVSFTINEPADFLFYSYKITH